MYTTTEPRLSGSGEVSRLALRRARIKSFLDPASMPQVQAAGNFSGPKNLGFCSSRNCKPPTDKSALPRIIESAALFSFKYNTDTRHAALINRRDTMGTPFWEFPVSRRLQLAGVALAAAGVTAGVILSAQKLIRRERVRKLKE